MENVARLVPHPAPAAATPSAFRDLVLPKEHGSWSLALEPLAFGLIAAPSPGGAWFSLGVIAAFFARRPLRIAFRETRPQRAAAARFATMWCALTALAATSIAVALAGIEWTIWLLPAAMAGAAFLSFDLRNAGREEAAEIAGAAAFALLPAALAILGGATPATAIALALVMCGRAVPTVLAVRAALRAAKTGSARNQPALVSAAAALAIGVVLAWRGAAPWVAVAALAILALRSLALLVFPKPTLRARTIGAIETILGLGFVLVVAAGWRA